MVRACLIVTLFCSTAPALIACNSEVHYTTAAPVDEISVTSLDGDQE